MGPQIDIVGAYLDRLYRRGIVVVCSAGNQGLHGFPLNLHTPRLHGGTDTPLIVVGATSFDENRWSGSQVIDPNDQGILSIYANGVDVVSASFQGDDLYTTATGTSEATALTSGLVAYLLANDVLQAQFLTDGLSNVAINVKNHIRQLATRMKGVARTDPSLNTPDTVPRLANGESIQCPIQNGQVVHPTYQFPPQSQEILPAAFPSILVAEGLDVVLPQNQLVSYSPSSRLSLDMRSLLDLPLTTLLLAFMCPYAIISP